MQTLRILITNDDGIRAAGIAALAAVAQQFGTVKIVAPDRERSACGHSMTMRDPLRPRIVDWTEVSHKSITPTGGWNNIEAYELNGVPTDCINIGRAVAWPDGVDLVLSGINHGPNLGFDLTYSGTVAGAMEGCINGIRSISVSMALFTEGSPLHLDTAIAVLPSHLEMILSQPWKPGTFLNLNIPAIATPEIVGTRVAPMGKRVYEDRIEAREDPWGRKYFWQGGVGIIGTEPDSTDVDACSRGYVSVTPVTIDWTDYELLREMEASFNL